MKIGIIGAGRIGSTLARHFVRIGHDVVISNSRGPKSLAGLVEEIGGTLRAVTAEQAATFGQVVVVCIPYGRYTELPTDALNDKVVIDTCNYYPERDGHDVELDDDRTTSSEKIRAHTGANLVKAFNAIHWANLRDRGRPKGDPGRAAIPISGTDTEAKAVVAGLIRDIGFDPVDTGDIGRGGRTHQPGGRLYGAELTAEAMNDLLRAGATT
ncbi:NADPH-dependent F420 reductase [Streptomyces pristinaespiralis]|uniref:NADP oxidoreductase coenzyme F420-dependent n=2 Tax=Streptomyces pristinaespiralis TaxID=38300 RepID=D6X7U6_STRE2|nr:NAD(P)-binding domain-containing protein [Streptomyces pristinaespiralis]ALC23440.1 NADP oxidoreductase [Streptomyces pristinaespiralis]EFH31679.1 NADP oxidoreductase coenzyme F420-dependent [Streptomyces pristinaespiralis ATCC 25486]QMU14084.1 NAD(P)-binding domain-containing protein [Streptomyces pristinaespiralis]